MKTKLIAIVSVTLALAAAALGGPASAQDNNKSESTASRILCQDGALMQDSSNVYFICQIHTVCPDPIGQGHDGVFGTDGLPEDTEGIFVVFMPADLIVESPAKQFCVMKDPRYVSRR